MHDTKSIPLNVSIVTITSSRTSGNDASGDTIEKLFIDSGRSVKERAMARDDEEDIAGCVINLIQNGSDVVVTTGGTGVTRDDVTVEALKRVFDKELSSFGSVFAQISYRDVGPRCVISRATAGTIGNSVVFCLPGSPKACELAMKEIIIPAMDHIIELTRR